MWSLRRVFNEKLQAEKHWEWKRVEKKWKHNQFFSSIRPPGLCRIHSWTRQTVCIQNLCIKISDSSRLTGCCSTALRAQTSCGGIYKNVRWHRACHTVKRGISRCVSASRLPTPTFNYHTDDDIYSHGGPDWAWVSVSSLPIHQALRIELLTTWRNYRLRWCLINHQVLITSSAFIPLCWQGDWLMAKSSHSVTGYDVDYLILHAHSNETNTKA